MHRSMLRSYLSTLLPGLLLVACGGAPEAELVSPSEPLGTQEAALCSGLSVTSLPISGISTYQGEMAGSGNWTLSPGANAVRLEYYVDGALHAAEERLGSSGTWFFSMSGVACGTRSFQVKAFPMVVDSAGSRTTCFSRSLSSSQSVTEPCPTPPTVSLVCSRDDTWMVDCYGSATGGSGSYTYHWQQSEDGYDFGWYQGSTMETFYCPPVYDRFSMVRKRFDFMVVDSSGLASGVISRFLSCGI